MNKVPLSLYVHLPWCVRKCPYCDFNSHTAGNSPPRMRYIDALLADLDREAARVDDRPVETIFLGGGTPSLFSPAEIGRLLEGVNRRLSVSSAAEITMEANPGTVEFGTPAAYRRAGVNRLSIGAQSFDDGALERLGRIHNSDDIRRTVEELSAAGFDNFNLDLMHGLPGQTVEAALADIDAAAELEPTHISWYQLTLEPNTVFYARPPAELPDEEGCWEIQDAGSERLRELGYEQYEVSAWASGDAWRCRHNLNYWLFGDYLAIGAGAHGKLSGHDGTDRYRKHANPLQYLQVMEGSGGDEASERISDDDQLFEFMLNALRLVDGFPEGLFTERTGLSRDELAAAMAGPLEKGLVVRSDEGVWKPTSLGRRFLNDLQAEFLRKN